MLLHGGVVARLFLQLLRQRLVIHAAAAAAGALCSWCGISVCLPRRVSALEQAGCASGGRRTFGGGPCALLPRAILSRRCWRCGCRRLRLGRLPITLLAPARHFGDLGSRGVRVRLHLQLQLSLRQLHAPALRSSKRGGSSAAARGGAGVRAGKRRVERRATHRVQRRGAECTHVRSNAARKGRHGAALRCEARGVRRTAACARGSGASIPACGSRPPGATRRDPTAPASVSARAGLTSNSARTAACSSNNKQASGRGGRSIAHRAELVGDGDQLARDPLVICLIHANVALVQRVLPGTA